MIDTPCRKTGLGEQDRETAYVTRRSFRVDERQVQAGSIIYGSRATDLKTMSLIVDRCVKVHAQRSPKSSPSIRGIDTSEGRYKELKSSRPTGSNGEHKDTRQLITDRSTLCVSRQVWATWKAALCISKCVAMQLLDMVDRHFVSSQ